MAENETVAVIANYAVWGMRRGDRAVLRRSRMVDALIADGRLLVREDPPPPVPGSDEEIAMRVQQIIAEGDAAVAAAQPVEPESAVEDEGGTVDPVERIKAGQRASAPKRK